MLWILATTLSAVPANQPVEWTSGDLSVRWLRSEGLTLSYRGERLWSGLTSDLVLHDPGWTVQLASSTRARTEATLSADRVLTIRRTDGEFTATCEIRVGPGERLELRYRYRQNGWDAASLQLGVGRPREEIWAGAPFESDAGAGSIPLTYERRPAFESTRAIALRSLAATLKLTGDRPFLLYDYANRNGHFWLGWDTPLPRGEEQSFTLVAEAGPPNLSAGGVRVSELRIPRRVVDGRLPIAAVLAREADGPATVELTAEATGPGAPANDGQTVTLGLEPATGELALELPSPGRYRVAVSLRRDGQTLLAAPPVAVDVVAPLRVVPGRSYYTDQATALVRARLSPELDRAGLSLALTGPGVDLTAAAPGAVVDLGVPLAGLPLGDTALTCTLRRGERVLAALPVVLRKLAPKPGAVVLDHLTGGLVVDGLPYFPVGFYCDMPPLREMDEDAQMGWNLVGPYIGRQAVDGDEARTAILGALDRAAAVGLKVHYDLGDLCTVTDSDEKWQRLRAEIELIRDHPALLCWYLADEPELRDIPPDRMKRVYDFVREADPYHPCTQVFANRGAAVPYESSLDISMSDPYPIPNSGVSNVAEATRQMVSQHAATIPIWIVPQAFGGGEWWEREPSGPEGRTMTYLALIEGAKGIQYFIRRAPNGNPVSVHLWNEYRRVAAEIAELAPDLLTDDRTMLSGDVDDVRAALFRTGDALLVLAANTSPEPRPVTLRLPLAAPGRWDVVFGQRPLAVAGDTLEDWIDGFGTRAYRLALTPLGPLAADEPGNLVRNASLEEWTNVGTPDAYYMGRGDVAASARLDPRVALDGRHSLRLTTPADGAGMGMDPFPVPLRAGVAYRFSLQAKSTVPGARIRLSCWGSGAEPVTGEVGRDWTEVAMTFTPAENRDRARLSYEPLTAGVIWVDAVRLAAQPAP